MVRQFLHSNFLYTKISLAIRKFKRLKIFARFKNEFWCLDRAYVDELVKDNNSVNYSLVRQDVFDCTVDAKGMGTKVFKEMFGAFLTLIDKRINHETLGRQRKRICWGISKKMQRWRNKNFTLQWVRPKLHFLGVQYEPWKLNLTITRMNMDTSTFTNWHNLLRLCFLEEIVR